MRWKKRRRVQAAGGLPRSALAGGGNQSLLTAAVSTSWGKASLTATYVTIDISDSIPALDFSASVFTTPQNSHIWCRKDCCGVKQIGIEAYSYFVTTRISTRLAK